MVKPNMVTVPLAYPFESVVESVGDGDDVKPKTIKEVTLRRSNAGDNLKIADSFDPEIDSKWKGSMLILKQVSSLDPRDHDRIDNDDLDTLMKEFAILMGTNLELPSPK